MLVHDPQAHGEAILAWAESCWPLIDEAWVIGDPGIDGGFPAFVNEGVELRLSLDFCCQPYVTSPAAARKKLARIVDGLMAEASASTRRQWTKRKKEL